MTLPQIPQIYGGLSQLGTKARRTANWWPDGVTVAAYQPKGAASQSASYINLANPGTYDAIVGIVPGWNVDDGWLFNSASYLRTGIVPASGWSAIIRFTNTSAVNDSFLFGQFTTGNSFGICPNRSVGVRYFNGGNLDKTPGLSSGILAIAGNRAYRNGTPETGTMAAWSGTTTNEIYIGGQSATIRRAGNVQALLIANTVLSDADILSISAAMAAL